jgi:hypothetical protein
LNSHLLCDLAIERVITRRVSAKLCLEEDLEGCQGKRQDLVHAVLSFGDNGCPEKVADPTENRKVRDVVIRVCLDVFSRAFERNSEVESEIVRAFEYCGVDIAGNNKRTICQYSLVFQKQANTPGLRYRQARWGPAAGRRSG